MKHLIMTSTLFLGAVLGAQAQSIKATIPFSFEANGKAMPAGEYSVYQTASNTPVFSMRNAETHESVLLAGKVAIANSDGPVKLVFNRLADGYYLTELWDGTMGRKLECPRGPSSIVASTKPATRVVIAAHR